MLARVSTPLVVCIIIYVQIHVVLYGVCSIILLLVVPLFLNWF